MHGFNTFEVDSFQYPNTCARCAEHEPTGTWEIVHSTIEFPDGMPTNLPGERRNYNDYVARVPICNQCRAAVKKGMRLCWLVGAVTGAVAAFYLMDYLVPTGLKVPNCMLLSLAAAVAITIAVGWVLKLIAVDGLGFAKLDGLNTTMTFKNKEYQKLFDEKNPGAWKPGGAAAAAAKGW